MDEEIDLVDEIFIQKKKKKITREERKTLRVYSFYNFTFYSCNGCKKMKK